jgi:hypothetical protein|tara:strand:- start:285 stop:1031 length:747 start_codon:yes stop_codon:yes gene_type:complete
MQLVAILLEKKFISLGIVFLLVASIGSGTYLYSADENESSESLRGFGNYTVYWDVERHPDTLVDSMDFINDGEIIQLSYSLEEMELSYGFEPYVVELIVRWNETDETENPDGPIQQASCAITPDNFIYDIINVNLSNEEDSEAGVEEDGRNVKNFRSIKALSSPWLAVMSDSSETIDDVDIYQLSNITESVIVENLSVTYNLYRDYTIEIGVDIQTGGNENCPHIEEGEEVSYTFAFFTRSLVIEKKS